MNNITEVKKIPIDKIHVPDEYDIIDNAVEDEMLIKSIHQTGIQEPLVVLSTPSGYSLIDGLRRLQVAKELGMTTVPCFIDSLPDGADPKQYQDRIRFILDEQRQDLFPSQRATIIKQVMKTFNMRFRHVAKYLGVDIGSISNWLAVDRYIPEVIEAIDNKQISMHHAKAFDGMTEDGQKLIWKRHKKEFVNEPAHIVHALIREKYSPEKRPDLFVDPEKTINKISRRKNPKKTLSRAAVSKAEKEKLTRDLSLRQTELEQGQKELKTLNWEINSSTKLIRAIMQNPKLQKLIDQDIKEELDRFVEVYI